MTTGRRRLLASSVAAAALLGAGWAGWQAMDVSVSAWTPPPPLASALPDAPANAEEVDRSKACGSGGCWRELRLRPLPGVRPARVVAALDLDHERCQGHDWPDPRETCVGAEILSDGIVLVHARRSW